MTPGGSPVWQVGTFEIFPQHVPGPDHRLRRLSFPQGRATDLGLQCPLGLSLSESQIARRSASVFRLLDIYSGVIKPRQFPMACRQTESRRPTTERAAERLTSLRRGELAQCRAQG
jgi:hypothetical protein